VSFTFYRRALQKMVNGPAGKALLTAAASQVRDDARANARGIKAGQAGRDGAIQYEVGEDGEGAYADVGYAKYHPGFVLWWAEVGTRNQPAQPHLRPAVKPNQL
jgi:hypothetical protein